MRLQRQFLVYLTIGVLSAVVDVGLMQALLWHGWPSAAAVTAGFLAGLGFNYLSHRHITFKAGGHLQSFLRYLTVVAANYVLTLVCVGLGRHWFDSVLLGKLAALPLVAINGFLLGKYWIFTAKNPL